MAEKVPQSLSNHARFDPPFHFFVLPVFAITVIVAVVHAVRYPSLHAAWLVVFILAATVAVVKARTYESFGWRSGYGWRFFWTNLCAPA